MSDAIAALAKRFWSVHPNEIHPSITREQFYEQEMRALFEALEEARAVDLQVYADQLDQNTATMSIAAARIETLQARLDRAVTRGLEQVERIAALEAAMRQSVDDWRKQRRRIEALEAALQKIVEGHPEFLAHHLQAIARTALAPEQEK